MPALLKDCRCPICGGTIVESDSAYGCVNWKKEDGGCLFRVWKTFRDRRFSEEEAIQLINGEEIGPFSFVSHKTGKPYSAKVYYDLPEGKLKIRFAS